MRVGVMVRKTTWESITVSVSVTVTVTVIGTKTTTNLHVKYSKSQDGAYARD